MTIRPLMGGCMATRGFPVLLLCCKCRLSIGEHQQPWRVCDCRLNKPCLDLLCHLLLATILCLCPILNQSSVNLTTPAGSPAAGSPLDSLPAVPRSDHARSLFPGVGQSWEERQQVTIYTFLSSCSLVLHAVVNHARTHVVGKTRQLDLHFWCIAVEHAPLNIFSVCLTAPRVVSMQLPLLTVQPWIKTTECC